MSSQYNRQTFSVNRNIFRPSAPCVRSGHGPTLAPGASVTAAERRSNAPCLPYAEHTHLTVVDRRPEKRKFAVCRLFPTNGNRRPERAARARRTSPTADARGMPAATRRDTSN